jgi:hypothetical protein
VILPLAPSILLGLSLAVSGSPTAPVRADDPCAPSQQPAAAVPAGRDFGEMSVDRPDVSDSTDIVGRGMWQLESGISLAGDQEGGLSRKELAAPLAMLRLGLRNRLELRVSAEGVLSDEIRTSAGHVRVTGGSDMQIGAKWKLFARPRRCFLIALEPVLSVPTGSEAFTSGGYDPLLKLIVDRSFRGGFSLSANVVLASNSEAGSRFTQQGASASVSHALPRGWSGFVEISTTSAETLNGDRVWIFDTGASRPIGRRVQVDVSVGRGLSDAAADWFVGAGIAMRGFLTR